MDSPFMVGSVVLETPRKQLVNAPLSSEPSPSRIENKVASLQMSVKPTCLMHYANAISRRGAYDDGLWNRCPAYTTRELKASVGKILANTGSRPQPKKSALQSQEPAQTTPVSQQVTNKLLNRGALQRAVINCAPTENPAIAWEAGFLASKPPTAHPRGKG